MFVTLLGMSDSDVDAMRGGPEWERRLAVASTVAREGRAEEGWVYRPGQFDTVSAPTLFLAGSDSPGDLKKATADAAGAIAGSTIRNMEGHEHFAHRTEPEMVAALVRQFLES